MLDGLRLLASTLVSRARLGGKGDTFNGSRNVDTALGYKPELTIADYRWRWERNPVAKRIVEAYPKATWRGKVVEIWDSEDVEKETPFEKEWVALSKRLKVWPKFTKADILAGLGRYAILVIGAPGKGETELPKASGKSDALLYFQPFAEDDVEILDWDLDPTSKRFGWPKMYQVKRQPVKDNKGSVKLPGTDEKIHWTRVIHLCDGAVEDDVFGQPRLKAPWNRLDDLDKVVGAGSEAFWLRANPGFQFDILPDIRVSTEQKNEMRDQIDEFLHGQTRAIRTRGVKVTPLSSMVANFGPNVDSIISLISSGTGIPKRLLIGSELGELASTQDRNNWAERVKDRRTEYAGPFVVDQLIERLVEYQYLPKPKDGQWEVQWPQVADMSDEERIDMGVKCADMNSKMGEDKVLTGDEMREMVFNKGPMKDRPKPVVQTPGEPGAPTDPDAVPAKDPAEQEPGSPADAKPEAA